MSNTGTPTKIKKSGWFTKKEVTAPLLILNKLLDLEGDKRLHLKQDTKPNLGKDKKKTPEELETERKNRELASRNRELASEKRKTKKSTTIESKSDENVDTNSDVNIQFADNIDEPSQKNLTSIITQLNSIYLAINNHDMDAQNKNTIRMTFGEKDDNEYRVTHKEEAFVPEFIPSPNI